VRRALGFMRGVLRSAQDDSGEDASQSCYMKCVIQRVLRASVSVNDEVVGEIGPGMLILAAVEKGDPEDMIREAAKKIRELRIFSDDAGKMNRDIADTGGAILAVSQFTLAGSIAKGRRPGFDKAEEPQRAQALFEVFVAELAATGVTVETGRFREHMIVALENDGPVTFIYP
jgi:D-aminoacyl-tRNA deacylase